MLQRVKAERESSPPEKTPGDVGAVVHALRILRCLAASTAPVGVAVVARDTGISPSTCFNILRTLSRAGFATFRTDDKTYTLGMGVAELATGLVGISHAELLRPELERLALNYEMLVVLWRVTDDHHLVLLDRAFSETAVRVEMRVGLRLPGFGGGGGTLRGRGAGSAGGGIAPAFRHAAVAGPATFRGVSGRCGARGGDGLGAGRRQFVSRVADGGGNHP